MFQISQIRKKYFLLLEAFCTLLIQGLEWLDWRKMSSTNRKTHPFKFICSYIGKISRFMLSIKFLYHISQEVFCHQHWLNCKLTNTETERFSNTLVRKQTSTVRLKNCQTKSTRMWNHLSGVNQFARTKACSFYLV